MLSGWWGVDRSFVEPVQNGAYTLLWGVSDTGIRYITSGIITALNPSGKLVISNIVYISADKPVLGLMSLAITAERENGQTKLTIEQDGYRDGDLWDWYYEAVKDAWPKVAVTLKDYLENMK